jgi:hypothetical protein
MQTTAGLIFMDIEDTAYPTDIAIVKGAPQVNRFPGPIAETNPFILLLLPDSGPRADSLLMDGSALFQTLLHPGERLLWTGRPRRESACMLAFLYIFITVEIVRTGRIVASKVGPFPVFLRVELIVLAGMFVVAGLFLGCRIWRFWTTAYAVTDRRLFLAVGARRENMRTVALEALDPVRIVLGSRSAKWLRFCLRGTSGVPKEQRPPVWKFLVSGQPDNRNAGWLVRDPERVRDLIETARTAKATSNTSAA